ncbi:hypothetical protein BHE74_00051007 [Ensete ventricosum]|nr:hypothetical protein BHE74_00051007 [Ensete ventricosum]
MVFMRKISFKLRVMRLNRVELFYALVAAIGGKSRHCLRGRGGHMHAVCIQRWLATARPLAGATDHGLATYKGWPAAAKAPQQGGDRLRPGHLHGAASPVVIRVASLQRPASACIGAAATVA